MFSLFLKSVIFVLAMFGLLFATYGHSQEVVEATKTMIAPWWFKMIADNINNYPTLAAWMFAILTGVNTIFRGLSELLGFVAEKTATKTDDKIYSYVHSASLVTGTLLGWFGVGKPKMIEKVKKAKNE